MYLFGGMNKYLGVDSEVACHKLDINPNAKLINYKPRRMNLDKKAQVQAK